MQCDIVAKRGDRAIPVLASLQLRTGPGRRRALARIDVPTELLLLQLGAPSVTAAAIAEPVFGEGGYAPSVLARAGRDLRQERPASHRRRVAEPV